MTGFEPLPLGSVIASGWLRDQLRLQADGLTGMLEQVWPDVGPTSGWRGGAGECWERGPYYVAGLQALAWTLDDEALRERLRPWLEWTLGSARADGSFGPAANRDWWPRMVMLQVLVDHFGATGDDHVPAFVEAALRHQHESLAAQPLEMWAAARGAENLPPLLWAHARGGGDWLLDLADAVLAGTLDWTALYARFPYPRPAREEPLGRLLRAYLPARTKAEHLLRRWRPAQRSRARTPEAVARANRSAALRFYHGTHGVNHAMALRHAAYAAEVSAARAGAGTEAADAARALGLAQSWTAVDVLGRHHGSAVGVVTADEHLAGRSPVHGIELCSVVETMRSYEELLRLTGDARFGDLLEQVAFNALPAAMSQDLRTHQYYQQVTQVEVSRRRRPWFNGGRDGTLFGLEPTYGCCTANLHQGWPRLAASAVLASSDGGLAVGVLVPCRATAVVRGGRRVVLDVETGYPVTGEVTVRVGLPDAAPAVFPLRLRVPGWAREPRLVVAGEPAPCPEGAGFVVLEREWRDGDEVVLHLDLRLRADVAALGDEPAGQERGVVVRRGPLVLALALGEQWREVGGGVVPDRVVRTDDDWAVALDVRGLADAEVELAAAGSSPFSRTAPAVQLPVRLRRLPGWRLAHGSAGPVPDPSACWGEPLEARLVPYGATALRVGVLPRVPAG